jgi:hypothetical protein
MNVNVPGSGMVMSPGLWGLIQPTSAAMPAIGIIAANNISHPFLIQHLQAVFEKLPPRHALEYRVAINE